MPDDATKWDLTDEQYEHLLPYLPSGGPKGGRPWADHRNTINGILFRIRHGCGWRAVPERYGNWKTIAKRHANWSKDGTWDKIYGAILKEVVDSGHSDDDLWLIDGTSVRAQRAAAGARKDSVQNFPMSQRTTASA